MTERRASYTTGNEPQPQHVHALLPAKDIRVALEQYHIEFYCNECHELQILTEDKRHSTCCCGRHYHLECDVIMTTARTQEG